MGDKEKELIVNYALQNEGYLEIALRTFSAFDEIRKRIIMNFLLALEDAMKMALDDQWVIIDELKNNVFDRYKGFHIAKKDWGDKYWIGISSEQYSSKAFIIGVSKDEHLLPIDGGNLKRLLDEKYKPGAASTWWEWYKWVEDIYQNWDNEEVLMKMYKKDEAIDYFKDHILRIKEIAEPVIDEAVKALSLNK